MMLSNAQMLSASIGKMALSHAILAALINQPHSGYDLAKRFDGSSGFFWHASHQQIYRELSKLEAHSWVQAEYIEQDGRPNKKIYSITDTGKAELRAWITKPSKVNAIKDELLIKLFAGHTVPRELILQEIKQHYRQHRASLETYQTQAQAYSQNLHQLSEAQKFQYAALRAGVHYEMARLTWLEEVIKLLMP
jgi:DNA-binding PadR family transcriptional regulator